MQSFGESMKPSRIKQIHSGILCGSPNICLLSQVCIGAMSVCFCHVILYRYVHLIFSRCIIEHLCASLTQILLHLSRPLFSISICCTRNQITVYFIYDVVLDLCARKMQVSIIEINEVLKKSSKSLRALMRSFSKSMTFSTSTL